MTQNARPTDREVATQGQIRRLRRNFGGTNPAGKSAAVREKKRRRKVKTVVLLRWMKGRVGFVEAGEGGV